MTRAQPGAATVCVYQLVPAVSYPKKRVEMPGRSPHNLRMAKPLQKRFGVGPAGRSELVCAFLAVLPSIAFGFHAVVNANFTLLDDGMTVQRALGSITQQFKPGPPGRFMPLYWFYYWLLVRILPVAPWAFALGNAAVMTLTAWVAYRLATRLSGRFAGIVAAWLLVFSLPFIENLYTYGKQEPRHALAWLMLLMVLVRALERSWRSSIAALAGLGAGLACTLSKETGVLLAVPVGAILLVWLRSRRRATEKLPTGAALAAFSAGFPAVLLVLTLALIGRTSGNYSQTLLFRGPGRLLHWRGAFLSEIPLTALLVGALSSAIWLLWSRNPRRISFLALTVALLALLGFFVLLPVVKIYYLLPAVGLAAVLVGCCAGELSATKHRVPALTTVAVLMIVGLSSSVLYARAFTGWSWLYAQLGETIAAGRPNRVLFHEAGSHEVHFEADLMWRQQRGIPVIVGVLGCHLPEPGISCLTERDLTPGDWIIEKFGDPICNPHIPVRDFGASRPLEEALLNDGNARLPATQLVRHRAAFRCPASLLIGRRTFIEWRIYQVTGVPRVAWQGLTSDGWMEGASSLWLRPTGVDELLLPMWAYLPPGTQNQLTVRSAGRVISVCPGNTTLVKCRIPLDGLAADSAGWIQLRLTADFSLIPREHGGADDPRPLSFNLSHARAAGAAILVPATTPPIRS